MGEAMDDVGVWRSKDTPREALTKLNYHHLHYFWAVARSGSVVRASETLEVAQPTVSSQIKTLERYLGAPLFVRSGRRLALTPVGKIAYDYAREIFKLGEDLVESVRDHSDGRTARLVVGVSDVLPKTMVHRLLAPVHREHPRALLVCHEDKTEGLLDELGLENFDLVLVDEAISGAVKTRAVNHELGECSAVVLGVPSLVQRYRDGFPGGLEGAPFLLPTANTAFRRSVDQWLSQVGCRVRIVGEFEDSALLKQFARHGAGFFVAPSVLEAEVSKDYGMRRLGRTEDIVVRFYAVTMQRRIENPMVRIVVDQARSGLFSRDRPPGTRSGGGRKSAEAPPRRRLR